ncbi:MAG: hypothetical protein WD226_01640 [Planctomycetota bacterium]
MKLPPDRPVSEACVVFRERLWDQLTSWLHARVPAELGWDQHLLGCDACRALLAEEQALDELLALVDDRGAALSVGLAQRVLARLDAARRSPLDRLLHTAVVPAPPAALGARVLAGLVAARDAERLERLLDRVDAPAPPDGLERRVLAALAAPRSRFAEPAPDRAGRLLPMHRSILAAAALLLFALLAWRTIFTGAERPVEEVATLADESAESVPDELLLALDVLERWDEVTGDDLDVLLASLDVTDEALLTFYAAEDDR